MSTQRMKQCSCCGRTVEASSDQYLGEMLGLHLYNCVCGSTYTMRSRHGRVDFEAIRRRGRERAERYMNEEMERLRRGAKDAQERMDLEFSPSDFEDAALEGRHAECVFCSTRAPSARALSHFRYMPRHAFDSYYCGCHGWE